MADKDDITSKNQSLVIEQLKKQNKALLTERDTANAQLARVTKILEDQNRAILITDLEDQSTLDRKTLQAMDTPGLMALRESLQYAKGPSAGVAGVRGIDTGAVFNPRSTVPDKFKFHQKPGE